MRDDDRMIQLKSPREIEIMAKGGRILGKTLRLLASRTVPGVTTGELDRLADEFIRSHKGAVPAFKGLYGFPGSICLSINQEIVHGIPSPKRVLREGDILSIDIGVKYEGYYTDAAITVRWGRSEAESERLLAVTQEALVGGHCGGVTPGNHSATSAPRSRPSCTRANLSLGQGSRRSRRRPRAARGAAGPERGQAKARDEARAGPHDRDRADGQPRRGRHAHDAGRVDGRDGRRQAIGAFRATVAITDDGPRMLTAA